MRPFKIVLLNPPVLAVVESWYDRPNWGRIALAYLASYIRQFPEFEVSIIDAKLERLSFQQTLDRIQAIRPDVLGITAFTNEIKPAAYQAALVKKILPSTITVVGGVHLTALPQRTMEEFPSFDMGVVGEGEITFHKLCDALREGSDLKKVNGIIFRSKGRLITTPPRERALDLDSIPHPAWDLFPRTEEYWFQTMRGCPFNCTFCMNPNGRIARQRSVDNIIEEMDMVISKYSPSVFRFGDELFTVNMRRSAELMEKMAERGYGKRVEWFCQTHVRFVDYPLLVKMKKAGCIRVELGIETGDEEKLKGMGKGTNFDQIFAARTAAKKAGVPFGTYFLIGQPNETVKSIKKTVDLAVKMNPDLPMFGIMCPYPGTEVGRMAAKGEGGYKLVTTNWDEYNKQIGGALEFSNLTRNQIEWVQITAYIKVFIMNGRIKDFLKVLWKYKSGAWSLLKKALTHKTLEASTPKPRDYEAMINQSASVSVEDMIASRDNWQRFQKKEMVRSRKDSDGIFDVTPVRSAA